MIPGLAVCLIVRDEAPVIARALSSVRDHAAIVVVDTGSTDETPEIARAHGAQLFSISWPESFSVARNAALASARALGHRWALILDADEEVIGGWEALAALLSREDAPPRLTATVEDVTETTRTRFSSVRLCRLDGKSRYQGRIHEQLCGPLPLGESGILIRHEGYTAAEVARKGKNARNLELLRLELADRPDHTTHWHYAQELIAAGVHDQPREKDAPRAEDDPAHPLHHLIRALADCPQDAPELPAIVLHLVQGYYLTGWRRHPALQVLDQALVRWPDYTDLYLWAGVFLHDVEGCESTAEHYLQEALRLGDADPSRYQAKVGAGSTIPHYYLGKIREQQGRWPEALVHYQIAARSHGRAQEALDRLSQASATDRPDDTATTQGAAA